jgi:3',5'-nucleoside bisphosphate phosphatase
MLDSDPAEQRERLDLHCHTIWSSGFCPPGELVRWASMADVRTLAITDHHHAEAYREGAELAEQLGVTLIPAIELDCLAGGRRVDLLGYWINPEAPALRAFLARWPSGAQQLLAEGAGLTRLAAGLGVAIDASRLRALAAPREPSLYDLFVLLVRLGWAPTLGSAFQRWEALRAAGQLPRSDRVYASVEEGAAAIRAAGGVVALAHPGLVRDDATVTQLLAGRVVDAVETPYASYWQHGDERNARYRDMAGEYGVPTSAGTDYHAYPFSPIRLGVEVPAGTVARLRAGRAYSR